MPHVRSRAYHSSHPSRRRHGVAAGPPVRCKTAPSTSGGHVSAPTPAHRGAACSHLSMPGLPASVTRPTARDHAHARVHPTVHRTPPTAPDPPCRSAGAPHAGAGEGSVSVSAPPRPRPPATPPRRGARGRHRAYSRRYREDVVPRSSLWLHRAARGSGSSPDLRGWFRALGTRGSLAPRPGSHLGDLRLLGGQQALDLLDVLIGQLL